LSSERPQPRVPCHMPSPPPTKAGYDFYGWLRSRMYNEWDFGQCYGNTDITLYAFWIANMFYTVTFDSQGGTPAVPDETYASTGSPASMPSAPPTKLGYDFSGWYKEAGCINEWDSDSDTVNSDIPCTLNGQWVRPTP